MASANEAGVIKIVAERAGNQRLLLRDRSDGPINAGKSPDGVLANLTADKQMFIGYSGPSLRGGDIIKVLFTFDGTDGLDVSDGVTQIPFWENGQYRPLNNADLGNTTDIPAASVATIQLGAGYTIPANVTQARFGNGRIVVSIEDDTA